MFLCFKFFLLLCFCVSFLLPVAAQTPTAKSFFEQGLIFVKEQKFNEALEAFRQSVKLDPKQAGTHANIGSTLIALDRHAEAVAPFREAVKLSPNDGTFHAGLCRALSLTKNHAEAVAECTEGVRLTGDKTETHTALISALQIANRPAEEILRLTETALQKFPDNEILLNVAADLYAETGNISQAVILYEKLAQINANSALYQIKLSGLYLRLERDREALTAARKAAELEPKNALAHFFAGRIYFELGQHDESANAFQQAAALNENLSDALYFLGLSEIRRGKTADGIAALRKAVAFVSDASVSDSETIYKYYQELGSALLRDTKYEEAIEFLKKSVASKPKDLEAVVALGTALSEAGRYDEALPVLMQADRIKPGNEIVNMLLNVARSRQQMMPQVEAMKTFAKENPADLNVRLHLIQLLTYSRRSAEAKPYFDEIWKMNPTDARVYSMIGTLHSTTGDYPKAIEAYRKLLEFGENPAAYLGLADIYARSGQLDEAIKAYDKVFALKPDSPNIMKIYADFLRDNGKRREALAMYKRSLEMLPNNAPALFNAGVLSTKFGDLNSARIYLETLKIVDPPLAKTLARFMKFSR